MRAAGTVENEVLIGEDGELFLAGGAHSVLDFVTGRKEVPDASITALAAVIRQRAETCARLGIRYRHLIFPDKQSVLTEQLPIADPICLGEVYLRRGLGAMTEVMYPRDLLRSASVATYQRTDTHATDYGAIRVAAQFVEAVTGEPQQRAISALDALLTERREVSGDLGSKLAPPVASTETFLRVSWPVHRFTNGFAGGNNGIVDLFVTPEPAYRQRLLILGDSFGRTLAKVMSYFFAEVAFLRTPFFHVDIVRQMRPDVLMTQNVERYLSHVRSDEAAPCFFMFPYLARSGTPYAPSREFAEAFSAMLSYPRRPYREFMRGLLGR